MTTRTRLRWVVTLLFIAAVYPTLVLDAGAQALSEKDQRLRIAVIGYDLNEASAKEALAAGANINARNGAMNGETLLIGAIKAFNAPKVIRFLLDHGADANLKDNSGGTALSYARQYNIGRKPAGRSILKMLEEATGQTPTPAATAPKARSAGGSLPRA